MSVNSYSMQIEANPSISVKYQLFLPQDYETTGDDKYPLILFLHGNKKRGEDIRVLDGYGLTWIAEGKQDFPFIVVTPLCPTDSNWKLEYHSVIALVNEITTKYRVDSERICVTGFSMGGNGAWELASRSAGLFCAVVPISGWFDAEKALLLKDVPIWAFHCVDDDIVPVSGTEDMDKALTSIGGNIRSTYYRGLKHTHVVMQATFNNEELLNWLLKTKR